MKKISCLLLMPLLLSGCNDANSNVYKVTFDSKGGTNVAPQRVKRGGKAFKPTDPTREESEFKYWSYNGEEWSFAKSVVTENMTLEANYAVYNDVIVHYDEDKGSISGNGHYLSDTEATITASPKNKRDFYGIYSDENFTNLITMEKTYTFTMPEEAVELFVKFSLSEEEKEWNIAHGVTPNIDAVNKTLTYGLYPQTNVNDESIINALNQIEEPTLNGWYLYDDTYYAKLTANPYQNIYKFDNGDDIVKGTEYWFKVEPIKWNILYTSIFQNKIVLSTYLLDVQIYDDDSTNYANSKIRSWLNNEFYNTSFALDSSYIALSSVDNSPSSTDSDKNPKACYNTADKIYLPSYKEYLDTDFGFIGETSSCKAREGKTTDWARANGAFACDFEEYLNNGVYWTRSPVSDGFGPWAVYQSGLISNHVGNDDSDVAVRPCMQIKMN